LEEVVGIVVEYNPLHNGHLYHLEKTRELVPGASIVCVMSGNWTQRGEPAIISKWARARAALYAGVDMVLELPVVFSLQSAEGFASGAVRTLAATGVLDTLCFGSEAGDIVPLQEAAEYLDSPPPQLREELYKALKKGLSYPAALHLALQTVARSGSALPFSPSYAENIFTPNNILALEYLKALKRIPYPITPLTIRREGAQFHDEKWKGNIASATAVRKAILEKSLPAVQKVVPPYSLEIMAEEFEAGRGPVTSASYEKMILSLIRRFSTEEIAETPEVIEGMEYRIKRSGIKENLEALLRSLKTKRYTRTRLQRIMFYLLLSLKKKDLEYYNRAGPHYLRVLGFTDRGEKLLKKFKKQGSLPIVTRPAPYLKDSLSPPGGVRMMESEILATDLYVLGFPGGNTGRGGEDFQQPVIKVER